jgi:hypothetical protein
MTVNTTSNKITFAGNGATTLFPFTFPAVAVGDLQVYYTDASGNLTLLSPTLYTVVLNASVSPNPTPAGGSVTYPLTGSPIAAGTLLTIVRALDETQNTSFANQGTVYPKVIETQFDYLTMLIQQLQEQLGRSIDVAISDPAPLALPPVAQRAGLIMGFDSAGNPIATPGGGSVPISTAMVPVVEAATLALARTAMGLKGLATEDAGLGLQVNVSAVGKVDVNFPNVVANASRALVAADDMTRLVATSDVTLTAPRGDTLWNGYGYWIDTRSHTVTLALDAADNFENFASGTSIILKPGTQAFISTDAAGSATWYVTSNNAASLVVNKTATYSALQSDNGTSFILGGNSSYVFAVPAAAGIVGPYKITVFNRDGNNGKLISPNGVTPFWLYHGKSTTITLDPANVAWLYTDPGPWAPLTPAQFFIRTDGSDSNDGLGDSALGAWLTNAGAVSNLKRYYDNRNGGATINQRAGTYDLGAGVNLNYYTGGSANQTALTGDIVTPANVILTVSPGGTVFAGRDGGGTWTITGVTYHTSGNGSTALSVSQFFQLDWGNCAFDAFPLGVVINLFDLGSADIGGPYTVNGNFSTFMAIGGRSKANYGTFNGALPNALTFIVWIGATSGGYLNAGGAAPTFSGPGSAGGSTGKKFVSTNQAQIESASATFPGATAGTVDAATFALAS